MVLHINSEDLLSALAIDYLSDIDKKLDAVLDATRGIVSAQAGVIVDDVKSTVSRALEIVSVLFNALVSAIAGALDEKLSVNTLKVLRVAKQAVSKETIVNGLNIINHRKNYERYMLQLVDLN